MVQLEAYFLQRRLIPLEALASFLKMISDYIITEKEELSAILGFYEVITNTNMQRTEYFIFENFSVEQVELMKKQACQWLL